MDVPHSTKESIEQVEKMSSLLDSYGVGIVLISVFLVIFIVVVLFMGYWFNKSYNKTNKQNEELIQRLLDNQTKQLMKAEKKEEEVKECKEKKTNIIDNFVKQNELIKSNLERICNSVKADMASLFVFHNGQFSSHGLPFYKVSCICQYINKDSGLIQTMQDFQSLNLALIDSSIETMFRYGKLIIYDLEETKSQYPVLHNFLMIDKKATNAIGISVYDSNSRMTGIVVLKYTSNHSIQQLESYTDIAYSQCVSLSPILDNTKE